MQGIGAVMEHGGLGDCGTPELRRAFWHGFKRHLEGASSVRSARVSTDGWMWHNADLTTGNLLSMLRVRLGEIGVKYTLNDADANTVFLHLLAHRHEVGSVFDTPPEWRAGRASGDGSNVIEVRKAVRSYDRQEWPEHFRWLQRELETFHLALWPLVGRVPPKGDTRQWDEGLFMRELGVWNPVTVSPAKAILESALARGAVINWGRGRQCGSFAPTIVHRGSSYQLVSVRTDGTFALLFTQLKKSPLFAPKAKRLELLQRLNRVKCFDLPEGVVDLRPSLPLAVLADEGARGQFLDMLAWFEENVRSA